MVVTLIWQNEFSVYTAVIPQAHSISLLFSFSILLRHLAHNLGQWYHLKPTKMATNQEVHMQISFQSWKELGMQKHKFCKWYCKTRNILRFMIFIWTHYNLPLHNNVQFLHKDQCFHKKLAWLLNLYSCTNYLSTCFRINVKLLLTIGVAGLEYRWQVAGNNISKLNNNKYLKVVYFIMVNIQLISLEITHLSWNNFCCGNITNIRKCHPVTKWWHPICSSSPGISCGQWCQAVNHIFHHTKLGLFYSKWHTNSCPSRTDMFKWCCSWQV